MHFDDGQQCLREMIHISNKDVSRFDQLEEAQATDVNKGTFLMLHCTNSSCRRVKLAEPV